MTPDQIVALIGSQGLALALVLGASWWIVKVGVPKYVQGMEDNIKRLEEVMEENIKRLEERFEGQTASVNERLEDQTKSIDVLTAIAITNLPDGVSQQDFDAKMLLVLKMKRWHPNGTEFKQ